MYKLLIYDEDKVIEEKEFESIMEAANYADDVMYNDSMGCNRYSCAIKEVRND